jgi:PAS domain S-box-containing protein
MVRVHGTLPAVYAGLIDDDGEVDADVVIYVLNGDEVPAHTNGHQLSVAVVAGSLSAVVTSLLSHGFHDVWSGEDTATAAATNVARLLRMAQPLRLFVVQQGLAQMVSFEARYDYDIDKDTLQWNITHRKMFGYDTVENHFDWWSQRVHPRDHERVLKSLNQAIAERRREWSDEYLFRRADGRFAVVVDRGLFMAGEDGRTVRMVGAMQDVTEERTLRAQSLWRERMASLGSLANGTANEMRQPLMAINANLHVLRQASHSPAQLAAIHDAEVATELLTDLMRGMQLLSGENNESPSINVVDLVRAAIAVVRVELRERGDVFAHFSPTHPVQGSDHALLHVVVSILRHCADAVVQHRGSNVQVHVGADRHEGASFTCITIRHQSFIPPERFAEPILTNGNVGMTSTANLLKPMNGFVRIDAKPTETVATVFLPAQRGSQTSTTTDEQTTVPALLVVEADELMSQLLSRWLGRLYRVDMVSTAEQAVQKLEGGHRYDVLLSDVGLMVGGSHIEDVVCARFDTQVASVLLMTADIDATGTAQPLLVKPFDLATARKAIDEVLAKKRITSLPPPR